MARARFLGNRPPRALRTAPVEGRFFRNNFFWELFMGEAAEMALDQPHEGAPGWVRWSDRAI